MTSNKHGDACCKVGTPSKGDYAFKGLVSKLTSSNCDLYTTTVSSNDAITDAIVVAYDIFGFDIGNTRHFADILAEKLSTGNRKFVIVMPDFFRSNAWSLSNFPFPNMTEFVEWKNSVGDWDTVVKPILQDTVRYLRSSFPNLKSETKQIGIVGFCWGGNVAFRSCSTEDESLLKNFGCACAIHGAFLTAELAKIVDRPVCMLNSKDDPDLTEVKNVLDKRDFSSKCVYKTYETEIHGFVSARGDWDNPTTKENVDDVIDKCCVFFLELL